MASRRRPTPTRNLSKHQRQRCQTSACSLISAIAQITAIVGATDTITPNGRDDRFVVTQAITWACHFVYDIVFAFATSEYVKPKRRVKCEHRNEAGARDVEEFTFSFGLSDCIAEIR